MGSRLYFEARDGSTGNELWTHETTNDSTWQVADIYSGPNSGAADHITVMGNRLYFEADDGSNGPELWVHDPANGSTWMASNICGDTIGCAWGLYISNMVSVGDRLYFDAEDPIRNKELWMMKIEHTITYS